MGVPTFRPARWKSIVLGIPYDMLMSCFAHFYPSLTSLTLRRPYGYYRLPLQFVLQFPNLENLCLEWMVGRQHPESGSTAPIIVGQSPPLRGNLRLAGYGTVVRWIMDFVHELPNGVNFRSVELEDFFGKDAQFALKACAKTLENLTIVPHSTGTFIPPVN